MGADLYLMSLNKKVQEKYEPLFNEAVKERDLISEENQERKKDAQKKVSKYYDLMYSQGYFRDSYNAWSLLWQYDLSWWDDFGKLLNKKSDLTPKKAELLLAMLTDRKQIVNWFFEKTGVQPNAVRKADVAKLLKTIEEERDV